MDTHLKELIGRLERCAEPDRELDLAIHIALNPDGDVARMTNTHPRGLHIPDGLAWELGTNCIIYENWSNGQCWSNGGYSVPSVTSSIDAAMSLVPEGWNRRASETDKHWWWAELREGYETSYNRVEIGQSPSLPVSICIAALKARSLPAI